MHIGRNAGRHRERQRATITVCAVDPPCIAGAAGTVARSGGRLTPGAP